MIGRAGRSAVAVLFFATLAVHAHSALPPALELGKDFFALEPTSAGRIAGWACRVEPEGASPESEAMRVHAAIQSGSAPTAYAPLASASGPVNLARAGGHAKSTRWAVGAFAVPEAFTGWLLLGSDDRLEVYIDGKRQHTTLGARHVRDDDVMVHVDVAPGRHDVFVRAHARDHRSRLVGRIVSLQTMQVPRGLRWAIPDPAHAIDPDKLARFSLEREVKSDGLVLTWRVAFENGLPLIALGTRPAAGFAGEGRLALGPVTLRDARRGRWAAALPTIHRRDSRLGAPRTLELEFAGHAHDATVDVAEPTWNAIVHAERALADLGERASFLARGSRETVSHHARRLRWLVRHGDADRAPELSEAHELERQAKALEAQVDPFVGRTGPMRRALRSRADGKLSVYGLYVPESFRPSSARRYPLVVGLHGLGGRPVATLRHLFGGDDPDHDARWEERRLDMVGGVEAFVLTPDGHGNAMYRHLGEDDIWQAIEEVRALYPIDPTRISITGMSMGGTGSAYIALKRPDVFAAAAPLCGYQSYFVRVDTQGRPWRPWERFLAEARSPASWAENGRELPLYIVHGKRDWPERNSGVLIQRYTTLGFDVRHEHPDLGHNVWQTTYENRKGLGWLLSKSRNVTPSHVEMRVASARDGDRHWAHIDARNTSDAWATLSADVLSPTRLVVQTDNVRSLHVDREAARLDASAPVEISIDGETVTFPAAAQLQLVRDGQWKVGELTHSPIAKRRGLEGPFRDIFHERLVFVVGTRDPAQTAANLEIARRFARIRWGVRVEYPIVTDEEIALDPHALESGRTFVLVGNIDSNSTYASLASGLPIVVDRNGVHVGQSAYQSPGVGAAFVYPNPRRADRYVAVLAGRDATGTLRADSLPPLIPDFVIYDHGLAPAGGQPILGKDAHVLEAGFFGKDWQLPGDRRDPLAPPAAGAR